MIITITANTSIDHISWVPSLQLNKTLRATRTMESIGGKPTDCSWILGELGIPSLALGFVAGRTGEIVEQFLQEKHVTTSFIDAEGDSRRNVVVIAEDTGDEVTITAATLHVSEKHVQALREKYLAELPLATCVVLGGTLPAEMNPSFYTDFIALARERDIPVVFDAGEPNLSAGLLSSPTYIKPNRDELAGLVKRDILTLEDAYRAGREILDTYGTCPIISLGAMGGMAVLADRAYHIPPLDVPVASTAGAGDAVLAGITASVFRKQPIEEGIRLGFAAATAVVTMPGTAQCHRQDVERYLPQIELIPYP